MGLYDLLRTARAAAAPPVPREFVTPWGQSDLSRFVWQDVFGVDYPINSREAAMRIPALARGRNLIVSSIARNPLRALAVDTPLATQPTWTYACDGGASPQLRMAWTVDDLIFHGASLWSRRNGADSTGGFPLACDRINIDEWEITDDLVIEVNGVEADPSEVILIPGFHEGILSFGVDTLADTRSLYAAVRARLKNPHPTLDLHQEDGVDLLEEEIDALLDRWRTARQDPNGAVGFTSRHIKANVLESSDSNQLMIESRNAAAVDVARLLGLSASLLDATTPTASLNYETTQGRNVELVDRDLGLYMDPITARLSMDDVTPHGTRIGFNTAALTGATNPATGLED